MRIAGVFIVLTFVLGEIVAPKTEKTREDHQSQKRKGGIDARICSGMWTKDGVRPQIHSIPSNSFLRSKVHPLFHYQMNPQIKIMSGSS